MLKVEGSNPGASISIFKIIDFKSGESRTRTEQIYLQTFRELILSNLDFWSSIEVDVLGGSTQHVISVCMGRRVGFIVGVRICKHWPR